MTGFKGQNKTHGLSRTPIYGVWGSMLQRCKNPACKEYRYYGARGIQVCKKWNSFAGFFEDMGANYKKGLSIERLNVNGNYEKENCTWIPRSEQTKNRTNARLLTFNGETKSVSEWAKTTGIKYSTLLMRIIFYKWPVEKALTR